MRYLLIALLWLISLPGCEVIKAKSSASTDSTQVKKSTISTIDTGSSGQISKSETKTSEAFDWYKMTQLIEQAKPGDPKVIVVEGGKGTKEQVSYGVDSNWIKNYLLYREDKSDSTSKQTDIKEKGKQSETKGLGAFMVVLIVIAGIFVYALIDKGILSKFKMVRR